MKIHNALACTVLSLALAALLCPAPTARAAVEFTSFGADDAFNRGGGSYVGGSTPGFPYQALANEFTASFTGILSSVDVATAITPGLDGDGNLTVALYPNNPVTNLPLTSGEITLGTVGSPDGVVTLTPSSTTIPLVGGAAYWLALVPADAQTTSLWFAADNENAAPVARSTSAGASYSSYSEANAFDVNATPTLAPEPSTLAALTSGLIAFGLMYRRRARCAYGWPRNGAGSKS